MRIVRWIGAAALSLAMAFPAWADVRSDLIRLLRQISEETPVREELIRNGFTGKKLALAERQSKVFMRDDRIVGFIADRLIAANEGKLSPDFRDNGLITPLIIRGLGHLPTREMVQFYRVEHLVMKSLPERDCGLAVKDRLPNPRWVRLTSKVEAQLSLKTLKSYYDIQLKAARLGATRQPVRLTEAQQKAIVTRVNSALEARIANEKHARQMGYALNNLNSVSNKRACAAGVLFMDTVLSLKGQELRQALILLSE